MHRMRNSRHLISTVTYELTLEFSSCNLSCFVFFFLESSWKWYVPFTYQLDTSLPPTWTGNNWVSLPLIEYLDSYHHSPPPLTVSYHLIWLCFILLLLNCSHISITLGLRSLFYFVLSLKISPDTLWLYISIHFPLSSLFLSQFFSIFLPN